MSDASFSFGKNWENFLQKTLTPQKEQEAVQSIKQFAGIESLRGKSFVDIGCGSGLFSLAAQGLGAERIVSFDVDPFSVRCCQFLHEREGKPANWIVEEGSALDPAYLQKLGTFDFVYSWGVLHHTGKMREAIRNAASLVKPQGLLFIAIYNTSDIAGLHADGRFGTSKFWVWEKRNYNRLPAFFQRCVDYVAAACMCVLYVVTLRNPVRKMREHTSQYRGMDWLTDIRDWLGGYPYEHARAHEIFALLKGEGFTLENLRTVNDLRNNEFLFRKL